MPSCAVRRKRPRVRARGRVEGAGLAISFRPDLVDKTVAVWLSLDQVFRLADRFCMLRRGKQIGIRNTAGTDKNEIIAMITGLQQ